MDLLRDITIYYKVDNEYKRKQLKASFRNVTTTTRQKYGLDEMDNALIRIFDIQDYLKTWHISQEDIIVKGIANDTLKTDAPMTYLESKYGKNNVYRVNEVRDDYIFGSALDHLKIGAI